MKTIKLFILIMLIPAFGFAWPCKDCLTVSGKIIALDKAYITVYAQDTSSDSNGWTMLAETKPRRHYSVQLNPTVNYRIEFRSEETGRVKTLYVIAGQMGDYHEIVDVKFISIKDNAAYIRQVSDERYCFPKRMKEEHILCIVE